MLKMYRTGAEAVSVLKRLPERDYYRGKPMDFSSRSKNVPVRLNLSNIQLFRDYQGCIFHDRSA